MSNVVIHMYKDKRPVMGAQLSSMESVMRPFAIAGSQSERGRRIEKP